MTVRNLMSPHGVIIIEVEMTFHLILTDAEAAVLTVAGIDPTIIVIDQ